MSDKLAAWNVQEADFQIAGNVSDQLKSSDTYSHGICRAGQAYSPKNCGGGAGILNLFLFNQTLSAH